ncbi:MAG TPA: DUF2238 domain-containing protein [Tenericutes bacterium]|nr:DUF2238 domain-containing protein [Mycoplasmatota bacterium]
MNKKIIVLSEIVVVFIALIDLLLNIKYNDFFFVLKILAIVPLLVIPRYIEKKLKMNISYLFKYIYVIYVFLSYYLGIIHKFYLTVFIFDKLVHLYFGIVLAIITEEIVYKKIIKNKKMFFALAILVNLSISTIWEIFEFAIDKIAGSDMQRVGTGVNDTMTDIILAFVGLLVYIVVKILNKKDK